MTELATVDWFPQDYAPLFYIVKGCLALIGTLLIVWHMAGTWGSVTSLAQRLRYFALLFLSVVMTGAAVEQVEGGALVSYRNLGALLGALIIIGAMVVSLIEDHAPGHPEP